MIVRLPILLLAPLIAGALWAQDAPKAEEKPKPDVAALWATGCLWEVGDNPPKVAKARKELIELGDEALKHALTRLAAKDSLETRCLEAVFAGWNVKKEQSPVRALEALVANIGHAETMARRNVANLLDKLDDKRAAAPLLARAKAEDDEMVRMLQLAPLARWLDADALPLLIETSRTKLERWRGRAPALLANYDDPRASARLIEMLDDAVYHVADAAQDALKKASPATRLPVLARFKTELDQPAEKQAQQALRLILGVAATLAEKETPALLLRALAHTIAAIRGDAADALSAWKAGAGRLDKDTDVGRELKSALARETDPFARAAMNRALERVSGIEKNG